MGLSRPAAAPPAWRSTLSQQLAQLVAEGLWRCVAFARMSDPALQMHLEVIVRGAVGTAFEVELELQHLRRAQLAVHEPIELLLTVLALHCRSLLFTTGAPAARRCRGRYLIRRHSHTAIFEAAAV